MNFFLECWDGEPVKRPTMDQVVAKLKAIITENKLKARLSSIQEENNGESSQMIQNFDNLEPTREQTLSDKNLVVVNEIVVFILKIINEGREQNLRKQLTLNYFNDYN